MHLHKNLKHLRALRGHSQEMVAGALGVKRTTLSGWENGQSEPSCRQLLALGDHYRIHIDDLLRTDLEQLGVFRTEELQRNYEA